MERTIEDAERDYDRALADGVAAVQLIDEKLRLAKEEARRFLAAVVLSNGGKLEVSHHALVSSFDAEVIIEDNPATNGFTVRAKRK